MSGLVRSSWTVKRQLDGEERHSSESFVYEQQRLPNVTFKTVLEDSLGIKWEVELVARFDPPLVPASFNREAIADAIWRSAAGSWFDQADAVIAALLGAEQ